MAGTIRHCPGCGSYIQPSGKLKYFGMICPHCGCKYYIKYRGNTRVRMRRILKTEQEISKQLRSIIGDSLEDKKSYYIDFNEFIGALFGDEDEVIGSTSG